MQDRILPMLPGYHFAMAAGASLFGTGLRTLRVLSFLHALLLIPAVILASRAAAKTAWEGRSLRVLLIPWLPSLCWLVYTDIHALSWCLFGYAFWKRRRLTLAGIALSLATLIRHNCVIFAAAFLALDLWQGRASRESTPTSKRIRAALPFLLPLVLVGVFALWRGDLVITRSHRAPRVVHLTQIWFALLLSALVWLPELIADLPRQGRSWARALRSQSPRLLLPLVLGALYFATVRNDHPWNLSLEKDPGVIDMDDWFLKLWTGSRLGLALGYLLIWCSADRITDRLGHLETRDQLREVLVILAASLLLILTSWLLCLRYDLVPLAFLGLLLPFEGRPSRIALVWSALGCALISAALISNWGFF